ncbi:hypothetical protein PT300_11705 [Enterobacteriaceae bacterium ESL0689]|nr:hypothetical protein [Enterobacteriaceae bacterium ESL0689]
MKLTPIFSMVNFADDAHFRRIWRHPKRTINQKQSLWVQYLLAIWGNVYRDDDYLIRETNIIGKLMVRGKEEESTQIEKIIMQLYDVYGLRGDELFQNAQALIMQQRQRNKIISCIENSDDAAFVDRVLRKTFHRENPVRDFAIRKYCGQHTIQRIAREIQYYTGNDIQYCRKRVTWCERVLEGEMFFALKRELQHESQGLAA